MNEHVAGFADCFATIQGTQTNADERGWLTFVHVCLRLSASNFRNGEQLLRRQLQAGIREWLIDQTKRVALRQQL